MSAVYHSGEIEVQTRTGVREMAKRVGNGIHTALDRAGAEFLAEQPLVISSSSREEGGQVWASILTGQPGFVHALDQRTIHIRASPAHGDPLAAILAGSARNARLELGMLLIDLETRDRMRLNGAAEVEPDGSLVMQAHEVYYNCPKYIQAREVTVAAADGKSVSQADGITRAEVLSPEQREWITRSDTFFIASTAPGGGADASHRGGYPGFVHVRDAATLEWPDYSGNRMFNTLGNITSSPSLPMLCRCASASCNTHASTRSDVVRRAAFLAPLPYAVAIGFP